MKGWKTVIVGALVALGPAVLQYFGGVDWSSVVPSPWDTVIAGGIMIVMRLITTTPVGRG